MIIFFICKFKEKCLLQKQEEGGGPGPPPHQVPLLKLCKKLILFFKRKVTANYERFFYIKLFKNFSEEEDIGTCI